MQFFYDSLILLMQFYYICIMHGVMHAGLDIFTLNN